jgi:murein DD-endopeptidase MepM/ murein hydrolase activator NlpD
MADGGPGDLNNVNSLLGEIVQKLTQVDSLTRSVKGNSTGIGAGLRGATSGGGTIGVATGSTNMMPQMQQVTFNGETSDQAIVSRYKEAQNFLDKSLPKDSTTGIALAKIAGKTALGVAAAGFMAAPTYQEVAGRAGNYFGASLAGGPNWNTLAKSTESVINGSFGMGLSSTLGGANAAAIAASRGVTPGSAQYNSLMASVGGAARGMNMANENSAVALTGMTQGGMSANLYAAGISTYDVATGKARNTTEIFNQMYDRMTMGQGKMTTEELNNSLQGGMLQSQMRALGMSQDQQAIFAQIARSRNSGGSGDIAAMSGAGNPLASKLGLVASETNVLDAYTQPVLKGFEEAANVIKTQFNPKLIDAADALGRLSGWAGALSESRTGPAIMAMIGTVTAAISGLLGMAATALAARLGMGALGAGAGAAGASAFLPGAAAGLAAGGVGYVTGKGANALGNAVGASNTTTRVGGTLAGAGAGAATGAALGLLGGPFAPLTSSAGAVIGTIVGGIGGFLGSGGSSSYHFGASFGATGGNSNPTSPSPNAVGTGYGATGDMWGGGKHTGNDYPQPIGTPVYASLDGIVINTNPGVDYGKTVELDHGDGYQTLYGHLSEVLVSVGQKVTKGTIVGKSGDTGNVTGPHLHYEVRKGKNNPVNPEQLKNNGLGTALSASGSNELNPNVAQMFGSGDTTSLLLGGGSYMASSAAGASTSSSAGGTAGIILGTGDQQGWANQFLSKLGVPVTASNIQAVTTWMAWEGGHWKNSAHNNPLNTTLKTSQSTGSMNSVGVQRYASWDAGLDATLQTIRNGRYGNILAALQAGNDPQAVIQAVNASPWGTTIKGGKSSQSVATPSVGVSGGGGGMSVVVNATFNGIEQVTADNIMKIVEEGLAKVNHRDSRGRY